MCMLLLHKGQSRQACVLGHAMCKMLTCIVLMAHNVTVGDYASVCIYPLKCISAVTRQLCGRERFSYFVLVKDFF